MTAAALRAILAQVPIVLMVAGIAFLRHFLRTRGLAMAVGADQFAVRAEQREVRIARMIKLPQLPAVRRVAGIAFLAQAALVHIVVRVAAIARRRRIAERLRRMALHAADDAMQSEQRKLRQVVIELHVGAPRSLAVAVGAFAGHFSGMRILAAMATFAIFRQLRRRVGRVAGVAV